MHFLQSITVSKEMLFLNATFEGLKKNPTKHHLRRVLFTFFIQFINMTYKERAYLGEKWKMLMIQRDKEYEGFLLEYVLFKNCGFCFDIVSIYRRATIIVQKSHTIYLHSPIVCNFPTAFSNLLRVYIYSFFFSLNLLVVSWRQLVSLPRNTSICFS